MTSVYLRVVLVLVALGASACQGMGSSTVQPAEGAHARLRFDGVYKGRVDENSTHWADLPPAWHYIRVYPDGRVLTVTSQGTPADLQAWFHAPDGAMDEDEDEDEYPVPQGTYVRCGNRIAFGTTCPDGTVDFHGHIVGDELHLDSRSQINGFHTSDVYRFVPWPK